MVTILTVVALCALVGGTALLAAGLFINWGHVDDYQARQHPEQAGRVRERGDRRRKSLKVGGLLLIVLAVLSLIFLSGATTVGAREITVVENTMSGQLFILGPGTHIFPFEPRLVPLLTRKTDYSTMNVKIEIGIKPAKEGGVEAGSNSPGRPIVKFYARGWAQVNPERATVLHKLHGKDWPDDWVENVWITALKNVQRVSPYDRVGTNPLEFTAEVEEILQSELTGADGVPLVFVSQLSIEDYDFSEEVNKYLDQVAQLEFERQQEMNRQAIVTQQQTNRQIEADTDYNVKKRAAEAYRVETEEMAAADANARKLATDAASYDISERGRAQAQAITDVNAALARSSAAYLTYQWTNRWNGQYPTWWMPGAEGGSLPVPFVEAKP